MAGAPTDQEKLNRTLEKVCDILNKHNIHDWFIAFGTLLGIVRENSCIQGDDDLDIMIHHDYEEVRSIFEREGFEFVPYLKEHKPFGKLLLKSRPTSKFSSFDFYFCEVTGGDYYTPWHKVKAINCQPLGKQPWRSTTLNLPNDYMNKIVSMYGEDWETPRSGHCPQDIVV